MYPSKYIEINSQKLVTLCKDIDVSAKLSGIYMDETDMCEVFRLRINNTDNLQNAISETKAVQQITSLLKSKLPLCSVTAIQNVMDDALEIEVRLYNHKRTWKLTSLVSSGSYVEILLSWILYGSLVASLTLAVMHNYTNA